MDREFNGFLSKKVESLPAQTDPDPDFSPPDLKPPPLQPGKQPQPDDDFPDSSSPSEDPVETVPPM
ncbi:MAG TPA: hypothetical protein VN693_07075 [Rhodanobacteraceae bacterium]|nr:hypothetical protein [Rhodanobacteraceae bacterium]